MDYEAFDEILMFVECEKKTCANVTITQDLVNEPDEFFTFHLNRTSDLSPRIDLDPTDGRIEIVDENSEQCNTFDSNFLSCCCSYHNSGILLHNH